MARGLRRSEVLQGPGDIATRIEETLISSTRGKRVIDTLNCALRWREFVARLPLHFRVQGVSQTKAASQTGQQACHVLKFVRRESLDPNIEVHSVFSGIEESPRDVVLLVKHVTGSEELAQVPEVCFPGLC